MDERGLSDENASGQAVPGWYFAQGDPPGTERYWNGAMWEGTYRAAGGFTPTEVVRPLGLPGWVKVVAWILTILKMLPMLALGVLLAAWGAVTQELEGEVDFEFRDFSIAVLVIGGGVLLVGVVLLLGQLVSVMKEQPGRSAIWSGILTALDAIVTIPAVLAAGVDGSSPLVVVFVLQAGLFAFVLKTWIDRRAASG